MYRKHKKILNPQKLNILPLGFIWQETVWLGSLTLIDSAALLIVRTVNEYVWSVKIGKVS